MNFMDFEIDPQLKLSAILLQKLVQNLYLFCLIKTALFYLRLNERLFIFKKWDNPH